MHPQLHFWHERPQVYDMVELAQGDVLNYESLLAAAQGCGAAFYLVHSMVGDPRGFTETDRTADQNMVRAAAEAVHADLEAILEPGRAAHYPQRETLPYEAAEHHLEVSGLRVEALEAVLAGRVRLLVTTPRAHGAVWRRAAGCAVGR